MKDPQFREAPEINPKTLEPPVSYICSLCGATTMSRKTHIIWHRNLFKQLQPGFWEGIDDQ